MVFREFNQTLDITRQQPGQYIKGKWQSGGETVITIKASIQPEEGKNLETLPAGRENSQLLRVYTDTKLYSVRDSNPDRFTYDSDLYEVITVEPWQSNIISHYKVIAGKIEDTSGKN